MAKIYIPNLLEFLYDCFDSRGKEYLFERLSREELKKVKSKSKIKSYVEKAKLEDIMIMLSKINCGVGFVIWDKDKEKKTIVQDVLIGNLEIPMNDLTRHLVKSKIFATQSIDIIRSLLVTSKASNSQTWSVNRKYLELGRENIKGFHQRNLLNKLEAERNLKWYVDTISTALELPPLLEHYKIEVAHFKILLFLQNSPNGATVESINNKLLKPRGFKYMLNKLYKSNMIEYSENNTVISIGVNGIVVIDAIISKFP